MPLLRFFALLTLVAALAAGVARPAAAQSANVTHVYDVMALTTRTSNDPGPVLGFDEPSAYIPDTPQGEDGGHGITTDALAELLRTNVDPEGWEGEQHISVRDAAIVVSAPPEVQAKIAALLAWLRAKQASLITLEVSEYQGPASAAETVLGGGSVLDPERASALARAPWRRTRAARVVAYSGQRLHVARVEDTSYLSDYDIEVAEAAHGFDPDVRTLPTGSVVDATAVIADGGHAVLVELRDTTYAPVLPMVTFETGLRTMSDKLLSPVELPRTQARRLRGGLWIPAGGQAIAGATRDGDDLRVVVVRHVHKPVALPAPPAGDGKRMMRIFDTRYSLFTAADFAPPRLRGSLGSSGGGGVGGAIFSTGDEGTRLSPDALVEVVKHDVDEDSWHNDRNRISIIGGQLVVHQTSEAIALLDAYLAKLERFRSLSLFVRSQVLEAADLATEEQLLAHVGSALSPGDKAALLERIAAGTGLAAVSDTSTAALPGQKVFTAAYRSDSYVKDYDIEIATKTSMLDPEIAAFRHGVVCSVRPTMIQADGQVMLELILEEQALVETSVREVGDGIKLMAPALAGGQRIVRVVLAEGGTTLVDLGNRRFARIEVHVSREAKKAGSDK